LRFKLSTNRQSYLFLLITRKVNDNISFPSPSKRKRKREWVSEW
jgi:hypothetical protein